MTVNEFMMNGNNRTFKWWYNKQKVTLLRYKWIKVLAQKIQRVEQKKKRTNNYVDNLKLQENQNTFSDRVVLGESKEIQIFYNNEN